MNIPKVSSKKLLLPLVIGGLFAGNVMAAGPLAVDLGSAGSFAILSQSGITDVYRSAIVGDVGTSPITGAVAFNKEEMLRNNKYANVYSKLIFTLNNGQGFTLSPLRICIEEYSLDVSVGVFDYKTHR